MTRNEEYKALLAALEQPPEGLEQTVAKALQRETASRKKRRVFGIPAGSLAACFLGFVLLVNLFPPFARACGTVPLLRELAKAVAWSPSLSAAVENEYVQPIGQSQTANGVTATVEYVIVDQKQLNVYYTLDSRDDLQLEADACLRVPDTGWSGGSGSYGTPNGELREIRLDFIDTDMPAALELEVKVFAGHGSEEPAEPDAQVGQEDPFAAPQGDAPDYLAEFTFHLAFDPAFTARGEVIPVDAVFTLDGRTVSITEAEVYPTHMRLNFHTDPANDAWLAGLDFYMEDETGHQFRPNTNGILSTGMTGGSDDAAVWLDSPYFSHGARLTLYITGAEWLDKEAPRVRLDLEQGTAENLPEGVRFLKAEKLQGGWIVSFAAPLKENRMYSLFNQMVWDGEGQAYDVSWWSSCYGYEDPATGERLDSDTVFTEEFPLAGYEGTVVYLEPLFSRVSAFEVPVAVPIQ